jgi:translocation and assembly module TamA
MKRLFCKFFLIIFFPSYIFAVIPSYSVKFSGLKNHEILRVLEDNSQLIQLQQHPPRSINALKYRAETDIPNLLEILKTYGYFDAKIITDIEPTSSGVSVFVFIEAGPRYILDAFNIYSTPCEKKLPFLRCKYLSLEDLEIQIKRPTSYRDIINTDLKVLTGLSDCGYPLASTHSREVIVDRKSKIITVDMCVNPGPLCHFGYTTMAGLETIKPLFIAKKIRWKEGDLYSPKEIEETQKRLLETNLFGSVLISHKEQLDSQEQLPMKITVTEAKHKNISLGVNFATIDGFGASIGWANRNVNQMGEQVSINFDISQRSNSGDFIYRKPDFAKLDQDYVFRLLANSERIHVYNSFSYGMTNRIDRKIDKRTYISYGFKQEYIEVKKSINNGYFFLLGLPVYFCYSTANHLLNPTKGFTIIYKPTPYCNLKIKDRFFLKQRLINNLYFPVTKNDFLVLAFRIQLGSIIGPNINKLPFNKLFLGGSDDDLRGYRYKTVSPKDYKGDSTGGRSAIYLTFEPRFRVTKTIGFVPFVDFGNVTRKQYPTPIGKWRKSLGIGLRYFTFFGPLRFDIGFPLNRSKQDPKYRVYVSIGQTF